MRPTPESGEVEQLLRQLPTRAVRDPEALWSAIQTELHRPALPRRSVLRRPLHSRWLAAAAVLFAVLGGAAAGIIRSYGAPSTWGVRTLTGQPMLDGQTLASTGRLSSGEWLVTDSASRARLAVGRIGVAEVGPGSRVRLERNGLLRHGLVIERGFVTAVITAPPRLFFVETPSAIATDLGCAYTLEVDSAGSSRLRVLAGWVELKHGGAVSLVPAGLVAEVRVGGRPGTPYPRDFPATARDALHRLDAGTGTEADLDVVLAAMHTATDPVAFQKRSALSLWHLLQRVGPDARERVYDRLVGLAPLPSGVTREGILTLNRRMLDRWRRDLHPMWSEEALPWWTRIGRRLWELALR
jgi:hypothetical protein